MKIENGFVVGTDWHTGRTVRIGVHAILKIDEDCGNVPPANRIYFVNGHIPHVDLKREDAAEG
jgi:hypothetical protein